MKTLNIELNCSSIEKAIADLQKYRSSLHRRLEILIGSLVQSGVEVAEVLVATAQGDSKEARVEYKINSNGEIVKAEIYLIGKDVAFIEFGAGIAYNTGKQHPLNDKFGFGPGTYPSKTPPNKAINPGYWFYRDEHKILQRSIGTEATMPLYKASETIRNSMIKTAVEKFMRG